MYEKWRAETITEMAQAGFYMRATLRFLASGSSLQRISEILCSIDVGEIERARLERRADRLEREVTAEAARFGYAADHNGDPRGCPFKLVKDGREIAVPGKGYPASYFDRRCR